MASMPLMHSQVVNHLNWKIKRYIMYYYISTNTYHVISQHIFGNGIVFAFVHVVILVLCFHLFFSNKCEFPRAWILSLMKDNIEYAEVQFFVSHFLPQAAHLRERGKIVLNCMSSDSHVSRTAIAYSKNPHIRAFIY